PFDQSVVSEHGGSLPGSRGRCRSRRADHDPRVAEPAQARREELFRLGLDGRVYRRVEFGHDRHLADDPRLDADRDPPLVHLPLRGLTATHRGCYKTWTPG